MTAAGVAVITPSRGYYWHVCNPDGALYSLARLKIHIVINYFNVGYAFSLGSIEDCVSGQEKSLSFYYKGHLRIWPLGISWTWKEPPTLSFFPSCSIFF